MIGKMFNNIPDELVIVIYTYLHGLKHCFDDIKIKGCHSRMNHISNLWLKLREKNENIQYYNILYNNLDDPYHIITHLSKCNCCSRHNSNIPKTINDTNYLNFINNYDYTQMNNDSHECSCTCRHGCRLVHRLFCEQIIV